MKLKKLIGAHVFSGIETGVKDYRPDYFWEEERANYIKFTLDGVTYIAIEDPGDGYRSYMHELQQVDEVCKVKIPNVKVVCYMDECEGDVLMFRDALTGLPILRLGTDYTDSYYPHCVMNYYPENMACNLER